MLHHRTTDPARRAEHIAERVYDETWERTMRGQEPLFAAERKSLEIFRDAFREFAEQQVVLNQGGDECRS